MVKPPQLNKKTIAGLRELAEAHHAMADSEKDRIEAAGLTLLLDWHEQCIALGSMGAAVLTSELPAKADPVITVTSPPEPRLAAVQGFTGDICTHCQNMTMRRNGTCLMCATCGETTGCS